MCSEYMYVLFCTLSSVQSVNMYCPYVNCCCCFFCTVWSTLIRISLTKALVLWWCDNKKSDLIWTSMLKPVDAGWKWLFPFPLNLCMEIRKEWKAHLSWGFMAGEVLLIEASRRRRHLGSLPRQVKPRRGAFHNLQQLFVRRARGLREFSLSFLTLRHLPQAPSLTHRPDPPASPTISFSSVPRSRWVPNRGKQTADPLSSKRGTDENGAFS